MPPSQPVAGGLFRTTSTSPKVASSGSRSTALYPSRFLTISSALSNRLRNCLSGSAPFGSFVPRTPPPGLIPSRPLLVRASSKLSPLTITTPRSFPSSGSTKSDADAVRDLDCLSIYYSIDQIAYSNTRPLAKTRRLLSVGALDVVNLFLSRRRNEPHFPS